MNSSAQKLSVRWRFLAVGIAAMLFAGIIYSWSILKSPFQSDFGWGGSALALNFTLTMCFFCLGAFIGGLLNRKIGIRPTIIGAGILAGAGFVLVSMLSGASIVLLYLTYGCMGGLGIGIAYNTLLSAIGAWFPDKKGLCSGALLMGFGASTLIFGNAANALFETPSVGWRITYVILGIALCGVLLLAGVTLRLPSEDAVFPKAKAGKSAGSEVFESQDYPSAKMIRRPAFWRAFSCFVLLAAIGNSVISFAKDLALSVGSGTALATTLVGVLSVCNGFGRIITGALFDAAGRRITMLTANLATIIAAGVTLASVVITSLPLCIAGLCLTGLSYGACPTLVSSFTMAFYGTKHYPTNMAIMNFNLMFASFVATVSSSLLTVFGGYAAPFILLLALAIGALFLNLSIRHP